MVKKMFCRLFMDWKDNKIGQLLLQLCKEISFKIMVDGIRIPKLKSL